ncbi:MAG: hypothetical protein KDJ36_09485 [Hyphomicrobiaceae bacterium]|nr:hypothetical protein [Hyphomicrobiaceae bacterium]
MRFFWLLLRTSSVIFLSLILSAMLLIYIGLWYPETLDRMQVNAGLVKDWLTNSANTGINVRYNVWVRFFIQEQQLLFMFLVVIMRIALLLVFAGLQAFWRVIRPLPGEQQS